ncbi:hypothetical protein CI102_14981 [Trichoderma harzianum]|nr:hypothetical protein CI102_14981 [Trichoderma harzianum]
MLSSLTSIYLDQGLWEETEELQVQALDTRKINLGSGHLDTLVSINNLAYNQNNQSGLIGCIH